MNLSSLSIKYLQALECLCDECADNPELHHIIHAARNVSSHYLEQRWLVEMLRADDESNTGTFYHLALSTIDHALGKSNFTCRSHTFAKSISDRATQVHKRYMQSRQL